MKTQFSIGSRVVSKTVVKNFAIANLTSRRAARLVVVDVQKDSEGNAVMYVCENKYGCIGIFAASDIESY